MQAGTQTRNSHLTDLQRTRFRYWLQSRFADRCQKNSRYSLRAFAKNLEMDPSSVSQILSGKRVPSTGAVLKLCEKLSATPKDLKILGMLATPADQPDGFFTLAEDTFAVMADWYHFAILELTFTARCKADPAWIARELDLSLPETKLAIDRLIRLGLMAKNKGRLVKTQESITNHDGIQSSAARKSLQKQVLAKALNAIEDTPQAEKDISSMTMAIDPKNLDRARDMIKRFRRELCDVLEQGNPSRVFNLGIQLYPISKGAES